jgi:hypothetical protein
MAPRQPDVERTVAPAHRGAGTRYLQNAVDVEAHLTGRGVEDRREVGPFAARRRDSAEQATVSADGAADRMGHQEGPFGVIKKAG